MKKNIDISIIMPVYNGAKRIGVCLDALMKQTLPKDRYEIVIIDNNSTDNLLEVLNKYQRKFPGVIVYDKEVERGASAARNKGLKVAKGKYFSFTDDDCVPEPNWLEVILQSFQGSDIDAIQGKIILATPIPKDTKYSLDFLDTRLAKVDYYSHFCEMGSKNMVGANMSYRREIFDKFEGFNTYEAFHLNDDTELSVRLMNADVKRWYQPEAVVHHYFDMSRLDDRLFLRQSKYFGRAVIFLEPSDLPRWRHFLYCVKELIKYYGIWIIQLIQNNKTESFLTKCKIYGYLGNCIQLSEKRTI